MLAVDPNNLGWCRCGPHFGLPATLSPCPSMAASLPATCFPCPPSPLPLCQLPRFELPPLGGVRVGCYGRAPEHPHGPNRDPFHPMARLPFQVPLQGLQTGLCSEPLSLGPFGPPRDSGLFLGNPAPVGSIFPWVAGSRIRAAFPAPLCLCRLPGLVLLSLGGIWVDCCRRAPGVPPGPSCDPFHPMKSHPFQGPPQGLQQGPDCVLLLFGPPGPPWPSGPFRGSLSPWSSELPLDPTISGAGC